MKLRKLAMCAFTLVLITSVQMSSTVSAQSSQKLKKYTFTIGAQSNKTKGHFVNLTDGHVLQLPAAESMQDKVDFIYAYGTNTEVNLLSPGTNRLSGFGILKRTVMDRWDTKNKGRFINMMQTKEARKMFKSVKTREQLIKAYNTALKNVKSMPNYSVNTHGPALSLRKMEAGDIFLFKSSVNGNYAIGRVMSVKTGFSGEIEVDIKVATK